jgi:hypothetical protein
MGNTPIQYGQKVTLQSGRVQPVNYTIESAQQKPFGSPVNFNDSIFFKTNTNYLAQEQYCQFTLRNMPGHECSFKVINPKDTSDCQGVSSGSTVAISCPFESCYFYGKR